MISFVNCFVATYPHPLPPNILYIPSLPIPRPSFFSHYTPNERVNDQSGSVPDLFLIRHQMLILRILRNPYIGLPFMRNWNYFDTLDNWKSYP